MSDIRLKLSDIRPKMSDIRPKFRKFYQNIGNPTTINIQGDFFTGHVKKIRVWKKN